MTFKEEIVNLKKELVILRLNKVTKQKVERHKVKKIQNKISRILQLNHYKNK